MKLDSRLAEADPGEHAADEAILFAHGAEHVERLAVDQAEVADVSGDFDRRQPVHHLVEQARRSELEPVLALARRAAGVDDLKPLGPFLDELVDNLGRILKVGVHQNDGVALRLVEARRHRQLLTEIARQSDEPVARVGFRPRLENDRAAIRAAVVDENNLGGAIQIGKHPVKPMKQQRQDGLLVEDRYHQRIFGPCRQESTRKPVQDRTARRTETTLAAQWLIKPDERYLRVHMATPSADSTGA